MTPCPSCGAALGTGQAFCSACGAGPFATAPPSPTAPPGPTAPPPGWGPPPPPFSPPPPPTPTPTARPDLSWLVRGNWAAAVATAAVALGVAVVCALAFALMLDVNGIDDLGTDVGAWDIAVGIVTLALSSLSIDVVAGASGGSTEMSGNAGVVPLLITLLSLGAAVGTFRRLQRTCPRVGPALGDAARAAVLLGLAVLVLSLVFRTGLDEQRDEFNEMGFAPPISDLGLGPSRGSALILPMLVLFGVLALACLVRGDWLGPRLRRVHDVVASPVEALGLLVALLPLLGLAGYAALLTSGDFRDGLDEASAESGWRRVIASMTLAVSNVGAAFLGIGAGGRLGGRAEASFGSEPDDGLSESASWWGRLARLADETDAWGLWFAIPVALVVLALLAWFVVRRSARRGRQPLGSLLVWCGLLFAALPLLARLASLHAAGESEWEFAGETGEASGSAFLGLPSADALLLALVGAGLALLVALLTGLVDLRGAAARMQATYPGGGRHPYPGWRWDGRAQQWVPDPSTLPPPPPSGGPPPQQQD